MAKVNLANAPRVRFADEDDILDRYASTDEVDRAVPQNNVHFIKSRSSSETSLFLRIQSFNKNGKYSRRLSLDSKNNNNTEQQNENYVDKFTKRFSSLDLENRLQLNTDTDKSEATKELGNNHLKRNRNIYSVYHAKTIASQRRKSLPLLNIPKLIGQRVHEDSKQRIVPVTIDNMDGGLEDDNDLKTRTLGKISRSFGRLLRRSNSVKISEPDPVYKVAYLGNVLTGWARGENCIEKPLATLWRNYNQSNKPDVIMKLSIANSGLKGFTKEHGLTEYWSNRITYCASPPHYSKIFCWVYRHEGRKLKHELRCHAVLCAKESVSKKIKEELQQKLHQALIEFKKEKISKQNARLSLVNSVYENPSMPRRKILLSVGAANYKPPLERSKSAPKLGAIEELCSEEDEEEAELNNKDNSDTWSTKTLEDINDNNEYNYTDRDYVGLYSEKMDRNITCCNDILDLLVKQSILNESQISTRDNRNKIGDEPSPATPTLVIDCNTAEALSRVPHSIIDSDDGSVSSGCETASTVTSSDVEPTSLICNFSSRESDEISGSVLKTSVYDRVQSFEQILRNNGHKASCQFINRQPDRYDCKQEASGENNPSLLEVNTVPIGERNVFKRRSTYPPVKINDISAFGDKYCNNINIFESLDSNEDDIVFRPNEDNESACSDESGYSEYLDNPKESIIGNTIVV